MRLLDKDNFVSKIVIIKWSNEWILSAVHSLLAEVVESTGFCKHGYANLYWEYNEECLFECSDILFTSDEFGT